MIRIDIAANPNAMRQRPAARISISRLGLYFNHQAILPRMAFVAIPGHLGLINGVPI